MSYKDINVLLGEVLTSVEQTKDKYEADELYFETTEGRKYKMYHEQDCCESVELVEVIGELNDLIGAPITMAEVVSNEGESDWGTETWTFYKLATVKGYVTLRWHGESNGYYSEEVDFIEI